MPSEADMQRESTRRQAGRDFFDCMLARREGVGVKKYRRTPGKERRYPKGRKVSR